MKTKKKKNIFLYFDENKYFYIGFIFLQYKNTNRYEPKMDRKLHEKIKNVF
jgi:hypothetical protein